MSAPSLLRSKRRPEQIRRATSAGRAYSDRAYKAQFALGVLCRSERDQAALFRRIARVAAGREVKVLVI